MGEAGNDILDGGAGNDILVGGSGSDTFKFGADSADRSTDTILDFTSQDIIDLSDILEGERANANSLNNYLNFSTVDGDTWIFIDSNKDGTVDLTIRLQDVDMGATGTNDTDIIQALLNQGQLVVDNTSSRSSRRRDYEDEARDSRHHNNSENSYYNNADSRFSSSELNTVQINEESQSLLFSFDNDESIARVQNEDLSDTIQYQSDDELMINPNSEIKTQYFDLNPKESSFENELNMYDLVNEFSEESQSLDTYLNLFIDDLNTETELSESKIDIGSAKKSEVIETSEYNDFELIQKLVDDNKLSHD